MVSGVMERILGEPAWLVYLVVGIVVFAEDALFVGFVIPGETAAILGGVAASLGHVSFPVVMAIAVGAAIVGDTVGFEVGKHLGPRILELKALSGHRRKVHRAQDFLARRGGSAVFLGRWTAFFRAVMPALAGMSRMHYPTFLAWNATGGVAWGATVVTAGFFAGESYARVEKWLGGGAAAVVALVALLALLVWRIRSKQEDAGRERARSGTPAAEPE